MPAISTERKVQVICKKVIHSVSQTYNMQSFSTIFLQMSSSSLDNIQLSYAVHQRFTLLLLMVLEYCISIHVLAELLHAHVQTI